MRTERAIPSCKAGSLRSDVCSFFKLEAGEREASNNLDPFRNEQESKDRITVLHLSSSIGNVMAQASNPFGIEKQWEHLVQCRDIDRGPVGHESIRPSPGPSSPESVLMSESSDSAAASGRTAGDDMKAGVELVADECGS